MEVSSRGAVINLPRKALTFFDGFYRAWIVYPDPKNYESCISIFHGQATAWVIIEAKGSPTHHCGTWYCPARETEGEFKRDHTTVDLGKEIYTRVDRYTISTVKIPPVTRLPLTTHFLKLPDKTNLLIHFFEPLLPDDHPDWVVYHGKKLLNPLPTLSPVVEVSGMIEIMLPQGFLRVPHLNDRANHPCLNGRQIQRLDPTNYTLELVGKSIHVRRCKSPFSIS